MQRPGVDPSIRLSSNSGGCPSHRSSLSRPVPGQLKERVFCTPFEPIRYEFPFGDVAQLVERLLCKQEVDGSIPFISTMYALAGGVGRSGEFTGGTIANVFMLPRGAPRLWMSPRTKRIHVGQNPSAFGSVRLVVHEGP